MAQELAEGEEGLNYDPRPKAVKRTTAEGLWTEADAVYYNDDGGCCRVPPA